MATVPARVADAIAAAAIERFLTLCKDAQFSVILGGNGDCSDALGKGLAHARKESSALLQTSNFLIRADGIEAVFPEE